MHSINPSIRYFNSDKNLLGAKDINPQNNQVLNMQGGNYLNQQNSQSIKQLGGQSINQMSNYLINPPDIQSKNQPSQSMSSSSSIGPVYNGLGASSNKRKRISEKVILQQD